METDQWLYFEEELLNTPSTLDGMSPIQERNERLKGCCYIMAVASRLKLSIAVVSTACTYFHRFYMRHSIKKFHVYTIGAACIFIATKVEEELRHFEDIVKTCIEKSMKKSPNDVISTKSKDFAIWWNMILSHEISVMEAVTFDFRIEHPHYHLADKASRISMPTECHELAWTYAYETLGSGLCLLYTPVQIAAAAVLTAATSMGVALGEDWLIHMGIPNDERLVTDAAIIMSETLKYLYLRK